MHYLHTMKEKFETIYLFPKIKKEEEERRKEEKEKQNEKGPMV